MVYANVMGSYKVLTATIGASSSLSDEIDIGNRVSGMAIEIPNAWTTANITFMGANASGGTFRPIIGDGGTEINVTVGATNNMIGLDATKLNALKPFKYIKVRSGTKDTPVEQTATRTIYVMVK